MNTGILTGRKNYAYVNARVRARRGNLVTDQEYRKLMKMDTAEIAEFLGKRGYDREMEAIGADLSGYDRIERAVRGNLARTYRELMDMAPEPVQKLLAVYFVKFDVENVKMILRATANGGDVSDRLVPTNALDRSELERMQEMETAGEVLNAFQQTGFDGDLDAMIDDVTDLGQVEDALDIVYYTNIVETVEDIGGASALFQRFLKLEALLKNVSLILRMRRQDHSYEEIMDRLIPVPERKQIDPEELAALETEEEILNRLRETPVGEHIDEESPAEVQQALETYKLKQGIQLMHGDQLGVNPVLGYMVCKEVEARNLRMIARAKEEGLDEAFMERNLIEGVAS